MRTITLDTGQRAKVTEDPWSITYQCAGCHSYREDCRRHSQWNGEGYTVVRVCDDCIERFI